jgi:hypothetical protein
MEITDTKQAYFDESIFPPLRALCPSTDLLPHSNLPDFLPNAGLPYDDDDEDLPPASSSPQHEDEVMDEDLPVQEDEAMDEEEEAPAVDDQERPDDNQQRRRLILWLGPHPTCVTSDINPNNILARRTRGAVAFSVTSTKPSNHRQAMTCDDADQWKKAEEAEIANMLKHNVWTVTPLLPHHHTIPSTWAYRKKLGADNQVTE